jgi:hypothetical protein
MAETLPACSGNERNDCTVQICVSRDFMLSSSLNRLSQVHILRSQLPPRSSYPDESRGLEHLSQGSTAEDGEAASVDDMYQDDNARQRDAINRLGCFTSLEAALAVSISVSSP